MLAGLIATGVGKLLEGIFSTVDQVVADKDLAVKIKAQIELAVLAFQTELVHAAASIITAEAQGQSWLQRNWRPLVMCIFTSLITAKWMGWSAPGISEAIELKLLDIIQIGLGGYVIGRSAEQVTKYAAPAIGAYLQGKQQR